MVLEDYRQYFRYFTADDLKIFLTLFGSSVKNTSIFEDYDPNDDDAFRSLSETFSKAVLEEIPDEYKIINFTQCDPTTFDLGSMKHMVWIAGKLKKLDLASYLGKSHQNGWQEAAKVLIESLFNELIRNKNLEPRQIEELRQKLEAQAALNGYSSIIPGAIAASGIVVGQMSGFGIYLAASSLAGTLAGAIGITLPFAVYTSLSTGIAILLGPVGWVAAGLLAIFGISKTVQISSQVLKETKFLSIILNMIAIAFRIDHLEKSA